MDALFTADDGLNSIELRGIASFKEHFTNHIKEDFQKDTELFLSEPSEIMLAKSRIPEDDTIEKCDSLFLEGSPFMIALALGEFAIAENILDFYTSVSISELGELKWRTVRMLWNNMDFMNNTIEIFLYAGSCTIPEPLRNHILQRIVAEASDLNTFSLKKVQDLKNPGVQKLLTEDSKKYPKLFVHEDSLYAHDIETLDSMLKIFRNEVQQNRLLLNNTTGLYEKLYSGETYDLTKDMKCIGNIVKAMMKSPNTCRNLYTFLLKIISQIQKRMMEEDTDIKLWKKCKEYQEMIWKIFDSLPFDEEDFHALREILFPPFYLELLYELAEKKFQKKMPLYITSVMEDDLMMFFGLEYEEDNSCGKRICGRIFGENAFYHTGIRLMRILPFVSRIEYPKEDFTVSDMKSSLEKIISHHAEELKDSFPELLAKGFIPDECLDSVMRHASHVGKCAYMRPLLIMQKFGGIIHDEG